MRGRRNRPAGTGIPQGRPPFLVHAEQSKRDGRPPEEMGRDAAQDADGDGAFFKGSSRGFAETCGASAGRKQKTV